MDSTKSTNDNISLDLKQLVPDYKDDPSDILISFPDIKAKTTKTLYGTAADGTGVDKSPKGSVDARISDLVDLINHHPSFSTLSSCSGRISLFQPWKTETENINVLEEGILEEASPSTLPSGKGSGGWLLVSHDPIDIENSPLLGLFGFDGDDNDKNNNQQPENNSSNNHDTTNHNIPQHTTFKMEPLLLHVAAATLDRGRQLLGLALELGFRESGLVLPSASKDVTRVTVAIRGMGLAMSVPLATTTCYDDPFRPTEAYLRALVQEANQRMHLNQQKLQRLQHSIKERLFRPVGVDSNNGNRNTVQCHALPDLNLWGHDAVVLPIPDNNDVDEKKSHQGEDDDVDVLVFGGYGRGPSLSREGGESTSGDGPCQRMGKVFVLRKRRGQWGSHWDEVTQPTSISETTSRMETLGGIQVQNTVLTPREGLAVISIGSNVVAIWGGRKGPNHALDEFVLYNHSSTGTNTNENHCYFVKPVDVRGELPAARWGHSFTSLEDPQRQYNHPLSVRRLALLLGGRNERCTVSSAHLLSLVPPSESKDGTAHFLWETICFPSETPSPSFPFHHATTAVVSSCGATNNDNPESLATIFVFGGLLGPCELLSLEKENHYLSSFSLPLDSPTPFRASRCAMDAPATVESSLGIGCAVTLLNDLSGKPVGDATTAKGNNQRLVLLSGGIPSDKQGHGNGWQKHSSLGLMELSNPQSSEGRQGSWSMRPLPVNSRNGRDSMERLDASVMVHHRTLVTKESGKESEVLLIGGGVMGFAFGPCFARCSRLRILRSDDTQAPGLSSTIADNAKIKSPVNASKAPLTTNVVYVRKCHAKLVKTEMERHAFLDKRFRMTPITVSEDQPNREIAIPITDHFLSLVNNAGEFKTNDSYAAWSPFVEGIGTQEMPFSTSQFAKKKK